jgi:hypothetical protein
MALPKITQPLYKLEIPSTKKEIMVRPMLVKEEKILLMAKESDDPKDRLLAIKQVVNNCIQTEKVDIDNLAIFDLEWLFLKLRSMSINNEVTLEITDEDDEKKREFKVNLDDIKIDLSEEPDKTLPIGDKGGLLLRYPTAKLYDTLSSFDSEEEVLDALLMNSLDKLYQGEEIFDLTKETPENLKDFVENNIPATTYHKVREFLSKIPTMTYEIKYENDNKEEKTITLSGLNDFFTF